MNANDEVEDWSFLKLLMRAKATSKAQLPEARGSVSASDVQKILDRTDWQKYWSDVNEAAAKEIEAYEQAEARSKRTNRFIKMKTPNHWSSE